MCQIIRPQRGRGVKVPVKLLSLILWHCEKIREFEKSNWALSNYSTWFYWKDIPVGHVTIRWGFSYPCLLLFPWFLENSSCYKTITEIKDTSWVWHACTHQLYFDKPSTPYHSHLLPKQILQTKRTQKYHLRHCFETRGKFFNAISCLQFNDSRIPLSQQS